MLIAMKPGIFVGFQSAQLKFLGAKLQPGQGYYKFTRYIGIILIIMSAAIFVSQLVV